MPFIGNQPAASYSSFDTQTFTIVNSQTAYSLDNPVANGNEILLYINNVKQVEGSSNAYTASGSTLTLSSALVNGTDEMYCVFLGKAVQTVNPPNGSVGASQIADSSIALGKLSATGTKDSTTFLRGDNTFATAGGTNTPAFLAYRSGSNFSLPSSPYTKVIFNAEKFDTASAYDTSTALFTVPSGQAGKYFLASQLFMGGASSSRFILRMRLNNSSSLIFMDGEKTAPCTAFASTVASLSVGDTVQIDAYQQSGSTQGLDYSSTAEINYFYGYKIIE